MRTCIATVLSLICSCQLLCQNELTVIDKDFDSIPFSEFSNSLNEDYGIQVYYFSGWTTDLVVNQDEVPSTLDSILAHTLKNTGLSYYINEKNQVILSLTSSLNFEFREVDSSRVITEGENDRSSVPPDFTQFESLNEFEKNWVVIGNPKQPEQKPKVNLSGYVFDQETELPIEHAIVFIEELQTGTTTDTLGRYEIELPQGKYHLIFQSIGLKEESRHLQIFSSGSLNVELGELILNLEEVIVRADRKEGVRNVQMGLEAFKTETIKELPSLLGEVDVLRSALLLPGVQSVGEFSAGFNVRGGGADQNLVLFNGAPVFNSSHLFGFSSAFSPDIIEGVELYKSSIPVQYGGRISSVMDLEIKEGSFEDWSLKGGISPVSSRLTVEGPIVEDRTSLIVSARSTYSDWILNQIDNSSFRNSSANYSDVSAHLKSRFGQNDHLDVSVYWSDDDFQFNGDTTYAYQNRNIVLSYQREFSERLFGTFSAIHSEYDFNVSSDGRPSSSFDFNYKIKHTEGKGHFSFAPSEKHQMNFGVSGIFYNLDPAIMNPGSPESLVAPEALEKEKALEWSAHLSNEWSPNEVFSIYGGIRFVHYSFLGPQTVTEYNRNAARIEENIIGTTDYDAGEVVQSYSAPEYRFSLRYALNSNASLKASFNRNRQYLSMLFNSATISPTATWKLSDSHILPQTGDQVSIGFFQNFLDDRLEFSVEAYYKKIQNMVEYKAGADLLLNELLETDIVNGDSRSYGIEFLLKKSGRKLNGWLSYTYSRSRFRSTSPFPRDQINQGEWFNTNYDKPHDISFAGFYRISKRFSMSSNLVYSTGRPITVPVAKYQFSGGTRLQYSKRNEFRVPDYFRWDISINLEGSHKKRKLAHSSWSLSIYNLTGRKNVYSTYFVSDGREAQGYNLSIFGQAFFTVTYNFKI